MFFACKFFISGIILKPKCNQGDLYFKLRYKPSLFTRELSMARIGGPPIRNGMSPSMMDPFTKQIQP